MQRPIVGRHVVVTLVLGVLVSILPACGADEPSEEAVSKLEMSVLADEDAKPRTGKLTCPGETAKERNICAALEVVAPAVFEPVPVDEMCTAIYGGPSTATVTGTYQDEPVSALFSQENGCEIARWNQIKPVLEALGLTT